MAFLLYSAAHITTFIFHQEAPSFVPAVNCTPGTQPTTSKADHFGPRPGSCGDYNWLSGASVRYGSESRDIHATATLSCLPEHFPAGAALGLENPVELHCGAVVQQENEPLVEWKVSFTGARAGLICAPVGKAVYDTAGQEKTQRTDGFQIFKDLDIIENTCKTCKYN